MIGAAFTIGALAGLIFAAVILGGGTLAGVGLAVAFGVAAFTDLSSILSFVLTEYSRASTLVYKACFTSTWSILSSDFSFGTDEAY